MLMNVYYENTIDTIDDMLASERNFMVPTDTSFQFLLASDPRMKVKELADRAQFYTLGRVSQEHESAINSGENKTTIYK